MPTVKPWYRSRTLYVNGALLAVFLMTAVGDASGTFHLGPEVITGLGIGAAGINFALRLDTSTAVAGTPAAAPAVPGK
jgi:hypothetical protein